MDAFKKLKKLFPEVNEETKLFFLAPSHRIRVGREEVRFAPYDVGDGAYLHAAFVPERNHIYVRFFDVDFVQSQPKDLADQPSEKTTKD